MLQMPTGLNIALDGCSLDELAERIGRAITRLLRALGEPPEAEPYVRAWIAALDPTTRGRFLVRVQAPDWPDGSDGIVAAVREGLAGQRSRGRRC